MKRLISAVKEYSCEQFKDDDAFEKLYIGEKDTCIPDELIGDDLLLDIKDKFYCILHPIRERLEKEKLPKKPMYIYIDPSYENHTIALLTHGTDEIVYVLSEKPWRLSWDSPRQMNSELNQIYEEIKAKLKKSKSIYKRTR